jgi:hypothetical protein
MFHDFKKNIIQIHQYKIRSIYKIKNIFLIIVLIFLLTDI